jgi:hypothetical protein
MTPTPIAASPLPLKGATLAGRRRRICGVCMGILELELQRGSES